MNIYIYIYNIYAVEYLYILYILIYIIPGIYIPYYEKVIGTKAAFKCIVYIVYLCNILLYTVHIQYTIYTSIYNKLYILNRYI